MQQFISLSALIAVASAYGYNGNYGAIRGVSRNLGVARIGGVQLVNAGLVNTGLISTGLVGGYGGYANGYTLGAAAVAPLAVQSTHQVHFRDVPSGGQINPISVEIDANPIPINMLFRSASSQLNVQQAHQGAAGSVQESQSEDEAHVLRHSVTKPVLQEVREVITPFRRITQEIQPVQEQINTIVARGVAQRAVAVAAPVQTVAIAQPVAVSGALVGVQQVAGVRNVGVVSGVRNVGVISGVRNVVRGNTVEY